MSDGVIESLNRIGGSYFGMLQGRWPLHLLSTNPLPPVAFQNDVVNCKVYGYESDTWSFSPVNYRRDDPEWFELQFNLPEKIAMLVKQARDNPIEVADIKQQYFSFLDISGEIGGIFRNVRLELDDEWIDQYIEKMKRKNR